MLIPDLFTFAYIPGWYDQLSALAALALPESWKFRKPPVPLKKPNTPILERYVITIFKKAVIDYNNEPDPVIKDLIFSLDSIPKNVGTVSHFSHNCLAWCFAQLICKASSSQFSRCFMLI